MKQLSTCIVHAACKLFAVVRVSGWNVAVAPTVVKFCVSPWSALGSMRRRCRKSMSVKFIEQSSRPVDRRNWASLGVAPRVVGHPAASTCPAAAPRPARPGDRSSPRGTVAELRRFMMRNVADSCVEDARRQQLQEERRRTS